MFKKIIFQNKIFISHGDMKTVYLAGIEPATTAS
uniref:Uncharacterized protein n=1 Tax=viral metagenome TaxID=1070528 RepID=A0A6C0KUU2_9ZZZZ